MNEIKKSSLVFMSKLAINVTLTARSQNTQDGKSWLLEIKTKHEKNFEQYILVGTRGEIRQFKQLNALSSFIEEIFGEGFKFEVIM